jgi:uncharacterized membrane protein
MVDMRTAGTPEDSGSTANLIYILYLVGLVVGVTGLVGVVMAYLNRGGAAEWVRTHYQFQIRTFWIGLLGSIVGFLLTFILIGFLVLLAVAIWFIIRCVKGMQCISRREAYPNPETWLW